MAVSGEFRYFGCWSGSIAPGTEGHDRPRVAANGHDQPVPEAVDGVAAVALHDEASAHEQRERKPLLQQVRLQRLA